MDPRILIFMLSALISTVTSELDDVTTIYRIHQPLHPSSSEEHTLASHVIHLRTNVLGKLLLEDSGSYLRPSVGMPQFHCVPITPNCSWIQTDEWTIKDINMDDVLPHLEVSAEVTCKIHNGGCQAYCQEAEEGFVVCTCPPHYELNSDEKTCRGSGPHNHVLDDKSGVFSSFNHPLKYDHNMFVTWMLVVPEHHHITLEMESFVTEACCDFLEVFDGIDNSAPKLAKLSGSSLPSPLHSTGNAMFLTFKSDGSTSYEGFKIRYTTESPGQDVLFSSKGGSLRSLLFRPNDMHLCVSLIYNVGSLPIKPWVSAEIADEHILNLTETTSSEYGEWKIGRFKATLKPAQMVSFISLYVQFQVPTSVFSIMRCNPYDDEDVYVKDNSVNLANLEKPLISPRPIEVLSPESQCKNGGVRITGEEECQCPPGITGPDCDETCGANSYGKDCGGKCSGFERGCHKMIFCKKYLPCMCAPGFEGTFCDKICSPGKFGANCWMKCGNCNTDKCNIYSGECTDGCKVGYYPPRCEEKYTQLASPPVIEYRDLLSVTIRSNSSDVIGRGNPKFYQVQSKEKMGSNWKHWPPQVLKEPIIEANITDLKPGLHYARILLIDEDGNSNFESDVPIVEFETLCVVPTSKEYHLVVTNITSSSFEIAWQYDQLSPTWCPLTGFEITFRSRWQKLKYNVSSEEMVVNFSGLLAGELYTVQVKAMTEHGYGPRSTPISVTTLDRAPGEVTSLQAKTKGIGELLVSWKAPRFSGGTVRQYRVEYECIKLLACSASCYTSASHIYVSTESVVLKDLYPHAQYRIKVAAMSAALGPYRTIIVATEHSAPTVAPDPSPVPIKNRTNTTLIVEWRAPANCLGLNGYHYGYQYQVVSNEHVVRNGTTQNTHVNLTDLVPHTPYEVWVHLISSGGWSNDHKLVIYAVTSASVSEPVQDLKVYKKGRHMIGIRWAKPFNSFGSILSFTVSYQPMGPSPTKKVSEVIEPTHCIAWPDLYCHTLNGLKPDTYYDVTVQARNTEVNNYGAGKNVIDVTKEAAPGAPTSLEVVNRTQTGMLIQWGPPWFMNGVLRSFILNVEETDSRNSSNCCQYFPIQELPIQTEQQLYRLDVGGLKPSSTFAFSISAKTVTLGPSLNISASTPPEPPALVHPPRLLNRSDNEPLKVLIQPEGRYPGLRSTYLLLVLTPHDADRQAEFWDWELQAQIKQLVNATFYAVAEFPSATFTQEKTVILGTGTLRRNGTYSTLENPGLSSGSYRAGLALILDYCGATSAGFAAGDSFTVS